MTSINHQIRVRVGDLLRVLHFMRETGERIPVCREEDIISSAVRLSNLSSNYRKETSLSRIRIDLPRFLADSRLSIKRLVIDREEQDDLKCHLQAIVDLMELQDEGLNNDLDNGNYNLL